MIRNDKADIIFNKGKDFERKELQSKIIKEIDKIETEYPDDDGTPFRISPEQFKRELKSNLNKLFEKGTGGKDE